MAKIIKKELNYMIQNQEFVKKGDVDIKLRIVECVHESKKLFTNFYDKYVIKAYIRYNTARNKFSM